jgi:hypothetical protein
MSPAALFAGPDLDAVAAVAAGSARITHAYPLGVEGAEPQARCETSQIVSPGCLSSTGRRNECQVSGMI